MLAAEQTGHEQGRRAASSSEAGGSSQPHGKDLEVRGDGCTLSCNHGIVSSVRTQLWMGILLVSILR